MQIIPIAQVNIDSLTQSLRAGKTFVYPTETCYGLGCDATNETAVQQVFKIKKRVEGKSVLVVFPDVSMAMQYVEWNPTLEEIARKYWPGPLTVVVPVAVSAPLSQGVIGREHTLAFRISSHPFVQLVTSSLGLPLVSTSANIAGEENPYDPEKIISRFSTEQFQPDIVVDAGGLPPQAPSTIVKVQNGKLMVLREGSVIIEE